jgi:dihydrolipoamide dehydrogenase
MADEFDLIVIGGGPGGYVAAIRAAQHGKRVLCVEKRKALGGTCLNIGCIPSKALLDSSELFEVAGHRLARHGIGVENVKLDLAAMMARKDKVVAQLTGGIDGLFRKNKVSRLHGTAKLLKGRQVEVTSEDGGKQTLTARRFC